MNYNKLKDKMREKNYSQEKLVEALNIDKSTLNFKLNNKTEFKISEVFKICELLDAEFKDLFIYP